MPDNQQQEIICDCSGTTKDKVKELIENGYDTVDKISRATGAVSGCGSCDILILELLDE
ncbi:MAG: (2Fe-2S)-binding protein [Gammaproteobacteria bacterium]|nr:MAG: (2Fe-2S)-binding protein [Gammaproteobacteria bacterium]